MSDEAGKSWIKENMEELMLKSLCFHDLTTERKNQIQLSEVDPSFAEFGKQKFKKITALKWVLLLEVMNSHDATMVLFTDLDVLWTKTIGMNGTSPQESTLAFIQNDTPKNANRYYFCTGVMLWKNNLLSKQIISKILDFQLKTFVSDELINDETAFNRFIKTDSTIFHRFTPLPGGEVVIGHRFFEIFFLSKKYLPQLRAFHANYVLGDGTKWKRLLAVQLFLSRDKRWIPIFLRELQSQTWMKLRQVRRKSSL